jgi:hypothetical protein
MKFSSSGSWSFKNLRDPHCFLEFCGVLEAVIVNCIKDEFLNLHDVFLCIHLHMYKYTHTESLLSQFTLYTMLFLCSPKCTDPLFIQFTPYTLFFLCSYTCTNPLLGRLNLHIVSLPVRIYAQALC